MAQRRSSASGNALRIAPNVAKFVLSPEALEDLDLIWSCIAQDNLEAADRVLDAAYRICEVLGGHPEIGRVREFAKLDLTGMRSFVITDFPNYIIFYRSRDGCVEIVRVLHGARDIERIFGQ